jgi:hypothetical protein
VRITAHYSVFSFSVAGLQLSAGRMASGGPFIGEEPTSGLRGADDGVQLYAVFGPVEHQASLTSEMAIALDLKFQVEYRMVGRIYFRLRLGDVPAHRLHFDRKR